MGDHMGYARIILRVHGALNLHENWNRGAAVHVFGRRQPGARTQIGAGAQERGDRVLCVAPQRIIASSAHVHALGQPGAGQSQAKRGRSRAQQAAAAWPCADAGGVACVYLRWISRRTTSSTLVHGSRPVKRARMNVTTATRSDSVIWFRKAGIERSSAP